MENVAETNKGLKAKDASLFGKIVGGLEILLGSVALIVLVCCKKITVEEAKSLFSIVIGCGFSIMGVFGTVDFNIILEKFTNKKEK